MASARSANSNVDESSLLALARGGDRAAFDALVASRVRELRVHCYRMLGALQDAEDATQETLLRAWRGVGRFEGRSSFRAWLYRIATNVCLNALASGASRRRVMPEEEGPPSTEIPPREPALDVPWLEPYPDSALEGVMDSAPGPDARYELRESVHLAFVAAIQHLPPRQRAALLLTDVLGWTAAESATLLDTSVAGVNSALQRARATLERHRPAWREDPGRLTPDDGRRALLDRYVRCWETADVEEFVRVLREDAVLTMPPWREWYRGREALGRFLAVATRPGGHGPFRLVPIAANGQVAYAFYSRWQSPEWRAHSIQLVEAAEDGVRTMASFVDPELFGAFGLPGVLAEERARVT